MEKFTTLLIFIPATNCSNLVPKLLLCVVVPSALVVFLPGTRQQALERRENVLGHAVQVARQ